MVGNALREALAIGDREVVALVGAGGKTTAMFRLARELRAGGAGVVVTTTTKILVPAPAPDLEVVTDGDPAGAVAAALRAARVPVVGRAVIADGKLDGIDPERVAWLARLPGVTHVLVEADGAARRPFKAPREGEPVIPAAATVVIAVVGVDAVGEPLSDRVAHRVERVTALTGLQSGDVLTAAVVARVLLGPEGNTRGTPHGARVIALVNKADTRERTLRAHDLAAELRRWAVERVVVASLEAERPIVEIWSSR